MGAHVPVQRRALGRAVEARTSVAAEGSIAVGVRGNLHAGSTRISGTVPVERWVSGLKVRRLSMSAADPLNIWGTRHRHAPNHGAPRRPRVYLDAVPVASNTDEIHMSEALDRTTAWDVRKALLRRGVGASRLSVAAEGPPPP
jgi:hypothetical protein